MSNIAAKTKAMVAALAVVLWAAPSVPQQQGDYVYFSRVKGDDLVARCSAIDHVDSRGRAAIDVRYCIGYLSAIADVNSALRRNTPDAAFNFCIPDTASQKQLGKVITQYGNQHPADWHLGGMALAVSAFHQAFPCDQ